MDQLASILLRRTGKIAVTESVEVDSGVAWVSALEGDLAARGWVMAADLRTAAAGLPPSRRLIWADWLLATLDALAGADRDLEPLYRAFPEVDPASYIDRLLVHLFAAPGAPCVLCGREDIGRPLDPCGHLVCPGCFPPAAYSGCPVCGQRLTPGSPYLALTPPPAPGASSAPPVAPSAPVASPAPPASPPGLSATPPPSAGATPGGPLQVRLLTLDTDPVRTAIDCRDSLVVRPGALSPADAADLEALVRATAPTSLQWLPATVASRETLARLIAWALHATAQTPQFTDILATARHRWDTATDVARTLWTYSGGDPGLVLPPPEDPDGPRESWRPAYQPRVEVPRVRVRPLPRPLRRAALAHLSALGAATAAEDMSRHSTIWKRLGERLHPYEQPTSAAAVAFAALRATRVPAESPLGKAIVTACTQDPHRLTLLTTPVGKTGPARPATTPPNPADPAAAAPDPADSAVTARDLARPETTPSDPTDPATTPRDFARSGERGSVRPASGAGAAGEISGVSGASADGAVRPAAGMVGVRVRTHAAAVEAAFRVGDVGGATRLLGQRPGELWRRLDHLLRAAGDDPQMRAAVVDAVRRTAGRVSPAVLSAGAAALTGRDRTVSASADQIAQVAAARLAAKQRTAARLSSSVASIARVETGPRRRWVRSRPGSASGPAELRPTAIPYGGLGPKVPRRLFFPRGGTVRTWTGLELRRPLDPADIAAVRAIADRELAQRADRLAPFDVAVLDSSLASVPAPIRERAGSAQLAGWPRGSFRALPEAKVLRLFLHWTQPDAIGVDLDLSCVFFDAQWRRISHCDYTSLVFADGAAKHSGDFTSAPAPQGATEYLDLDLDKLRAAGVTYAVPVVFSYSGIAFELLPDAFAGLTVPTEAGALFDPARVLQRFDLRGAATKQLPMVVDVADGWLLWTDVSLAGRGYGLSVGTSGDQLARAAADHWQYFGGNQRTTLLDLAAWHAAGRAHRTLLTFPDGTVAEVPSTPEAIRTAAARLTGTTAGGPELAALNGKAVFAAVAQADDLAAIAPGDGSVAMTVVGHPTPPWQPAAAGDLAAALSTTD